jgi:hypothetical protein
LVYRTHDPDLLNRIANSSAVLPFIREGDMPADWSAAANDDNVVLLTDGEEAIGAFIRTTDGIYQCHWLFGENCRGRKALLMCSDMVTWMRGHGATILWGTTPLSNRKALWFNRRMGAVPTWHDDEEQVFEYRMAG